MGLIVGHHPTQINNVVKPGKMHLQRQFGFERFIQLFMQS